MKIILASLVLLLAAGNTVAQESPSANVQSNKPIADAPAEPDKGLNRKIWEGYYNAELNFRYHLKQAGGVSSEGWNLGAFALVLGIAAWAIPFITLIRQHSIAVAAKTQQERLEKIAAANQGLGFWLVSGLSILSLVIALLINTMGHSDRSHRHMSIASQWRTLAQQWNDLRDARGRIPAEQLESQYRDLLAKQNAIEDIETPDLYDEDILRQVQSNLNKFLRAGESS